MGDMNLKINAIIRKKKGKVANHELPVNGIQFSAGFYVSGGSSERDEQQ